MPVSLVGCGVDVDVECLGPRLADPRDSHRRLVNQVEVADHAPQRCLDPAGVEQGAEDHVPEAPAMQSK